VGRESAHEIVVATIIVVIVLTILLPSRLVKPHPSESAAVANLRTINTAQVTYLSYSGGSYGTMSDLINARLLDETFSGRKAGYTYTITLGAMGSDYTAEAMAVPIAPRRYWWGSWKVTTPPRHYYGYYSVRDAVIRYSTDPSFAPAGQSGKSVQ